MQDRAKGQRHSGPADARAADAIEEQIWKRGQIDHEDVLYFAYRLLREFPALRDSSRGFPYLFIDGFQDTLPVQAAVVQWLAESGTVVGVIGDPEQAIYGFLDASPTHFNVFQLTDSSPTRLKGIAEALGRSSHSSTVSAQTVYSNITLKPTMKCRPRSISEDLENHYSTPVQTLETAPRCSCWHGVTEMSYEHADRMPPTMSQRGKVSRKRMQIAIDSCLRSRRQRTWHHEDCSTWQSSGSCRVSRLEGGSESRSTMTATSPPKNVALSHCRFWSTWFPATIRCFSIRPLRSITH